MIILKSNSRVYKTAILLFAFFLIPSLSLAAEVVSVKKDNVNVRSGPGTEFPVTMELFKGYPLKVLEKKGDW
ncbi:MAG: SH3 domain-containing protein, partial [Thermodesulfobacteriota bacterium]|nr:SH3 domain-containing protein [Thermodesulfobacteriota bacterium]